MITLGAIGGGIGGGTLGARMCNIIPLWNIDLDPQKQADSRKIGEYYRINCGGDVIALSVQDVAYLLENDEIDLPFVDFLLVTWSCANFSVAKVGNYEMDADILGAIAISKIIRHLQPRGIVFENVSKWQYSNSWLNYIKPSLERDNYSVECGVLNAHNFGVPQSRKRFIARCLKGQIKPLKEAKGQDCYQSIADLIPSLNASSPSISQMRLFDGMVTDFCVLSRVGHYGLPTVRFKGEPMFTVRAILADDGKGGTRRKFITIFYQGRWYDADINCLKRWQSFPDSFIVPDDLKLAVRAIGNALPPMLSYHIFYSLS